MAYSSKKAAKPESQKPQGYGDRLGYEDSLATLARVNREEERKLAALTPGAHAAPFKPGYSQSAFATTPAKAAHTSAQTEIASTETSSNEIASNEFDPSALDALRYEAIEAEQKKQAAQVKTAPGNAPDAASDTASGKTSPALTPSPFGDNEPIYPTEALIADSQRRARSRARRPLYWSLFGFILAIGFWQAAGFIGFGKNTSQNDAAPTLKIAKPAPSKDAGQKTLSTQAARKPGKNTGIVSKSDTAKMVASAPPPAAPRELGQQQSTLALPAKDTASIASNDAVYLEEQQKACVDLVLNRKTQTTIARPCEARPEPQKAQTKPLPLDPKINFGALKLRFNQPLNLGQ